MPHLAQPLGWGMPRALALNKLKTTPGGIMPTRLDDALIHQNYGTLEQVVDTDPRWFDRFYFDLQAIDGSLSIAQGIGVYPNMGVMDGFSLFCLPDKQVNVRASRELVNGNRDEMDVGPIHAEILVPMKSWRFWLEENAQGATYDFTYTSDFKATLTALPNFAPPANDPSKSQTVFDHVTQPASDLLTKLNDIHALARSQSYSKDLVDDFEAHK